MGYPMCYNRVVSRNQLHGDYASSAPSDRAEHILSLIRGDLRRLEKDQRDDAHVSAYALRAGVNFAQAKQILDDVFGDQDVLWLPSQSSPEQRPCTCHPDDNPPRPCPQKFAISECRAAAGSTEKDWRSLVREAKPLLLRAWEKSGEGAFGPIAQALAHLDSALSGTPVSARAAIPEELYDGMAVYVEAASRDEKVHRDHVAPVLDAVVRLIRRRIASRSERDGKA